MMNHEMGNDGVTPWRTVLEGALRESRDDPTADFVQLATVDGSGWPNNRTVVFRGFLQDTDWPMFISDQRSRKVKALLAKPHAAICWYIAAARQQFRLRGKILIVPDTHATLTLMESRRNLWQALSNKTRAQFWWPAPLSPRTERASGTIPPTAKEPPASFCLLVFQPHFVDHLDIAVYPHHRTLYQLNADGEWEQRAVNP